MACCILAAFLVAQFMAMLRRWAVFWGLARPDEGEAADTVFTHAKAVLRRPAVRLAVTAALLVEIGAGGSWLYLEHGTHIAEEADVAWSRLHGEHIVYVGLCTGADSDSRLRFVLDTPPGGHRG